MRKHLLIIFKDLLTFQQARFFCAIGDVTYFLRTIVIYYKCRLCFNVNRHTTRELFKEHFHQRNILISINGLTFTEGDLSNMTGIRSEILLIFTRMFIIPQMKQSEQSWKRYASLCR